MVVVGHPEGSGKAALCEALALRTGGSVLSTQALAAAAMAATTEEGKELQELQAAGKIAPPPLLLRLLLRAMGSSPAPFLLLDFPKSWGQHAQLESSIGSVACFLELPGSADRLAESLLKRVRPSGRVHVNVVRFICIDGSKKSGMGSRARAPRGKRL